MSKNINQVFIANPITTNISTDLMYFGRSPYGVTNDTAMTYSNFSAQFGAPYTAAALTKTDDTNVTLTLGGTPSTALLHAASITVGWAGTLSGTRGGTGVNNGSNTITIAGNISTAGAHTLSGAFASTFTFTNTTSVTFPTSGTLATTAQLPSAAALSKTDDTNVTLTLGGTPTTALLQATSLTLGWTGTLAVSRGGTGVSSVTTSPTASSFAGWDANVNFSANSFIKGYATTATAAGTTTLLVGSKQQQYFTGSTTQTVLLPVTSTLVLGQTFYIVNNSSGVVTVQSSGANTIQAMGANTTLLVTCILTSGTSAASWNYQYAPQAASGASPWTAGGGTTSAYGGGAASANGNISLSWGTNSTADGGFGIALGNSCQARQTSSIAMGDSAQANSTYTTAIGNFADATGSHSVCIGYGATTSQAGSFNFCDGNAHPAGNSNPNEFAAAFNGGYLLYANTGTTPGLIANLQYTGCTIKGTTTNDSAAAGFVGQVISSTVNVGSAVAATSNTPITVTSISLTAGDWDVYGMVGASAAASTTITRVVGDINTVNNTLSTDETHYFIMYPVVAAAEQPQQAVPFQRISVASTTTIYLVASVIFTISTCGVFGRIEARRAR